MAAIQGQQQQEMGERIRQHRKEKKLNQTQLGELLGIGTKAVSDYEKGKIKVIPFEKRVKMSSVLNIPVSELLYDNEKMACISTNEAVDELRENRLIKAVNAELEEAEAALPAVAAEIGVEYEL